MSTRETADKCVKCQQDQRGNFCSNCGHQYSPSRINSDYVFTEIASILNFEKGIFFTIRELLLRPGINIQKFILEDRNCLVKPVVFIIICSLIYTLSHQIFAFDNGYINYTQDSDSTANHIFKWATNNYGYINVLLAFFIAFWVKLFFKSYHYSFFEVLLLPCFVMGMSMLLLTALGILDAISDLPLLDNGVMFAILYVAWGVGQFFDKNKYFNYFKAFAAYFLGLFTFTLFMLSIGTLFDMARHY